MLGGFMMKKSWRNWLWLLVFLCGFLPLGANELPEGFVDLQTVIPSMQLELRYYGQDNFLGCKVDGYEANRCIISEEAAAALAQVQADLQKFGLSIKVYDAYRPQRAVDHFVRWAKDLDDTKMKAQYYPDVEKKNLFRDGYIAAKSSHSRGSTVDLTIIFADGDSWQELDMGTGFDFFGPPSWPSNQSLLPEQRAHRMLLQQLMIKHGFVPIKEEWWHFTLGNEPYPDTYFDFPIR